MYAKKLDDENEINHVFHSHWTRVATVSYEATAHLPWNTFVKLASLCSIKRSGTLIERRLIDYNKWMKVRGRAHYGDATNDQMKKIEIKSSFLTPLGNGLPTFRGVRVWDQVDFYYFIAIDITDTTRDPQTTIFMLTKDQLLEEIRVYKTLRRYNKKQQDVAQNERSELGTAFTKSEYERWKLMYRTSVKTE